MANIKISQLPAIAAVLNTAVVPIVQAGTTYQASLDNLVSASSAKDLFFYAQLKNSRIRSGISQALSIGDNDIYTVPVGKRAIIFGTVLSNPSGNSGNVNAFVEVKHSGIYYRASSTSSAVAPGNATTITLSASFVLEAGDVLAGNASTTAGGYLVFDIIEFDDSSALKSAYLFGTITGNNTVYTCPVGKVAIPIGFGVQLNQRPPLYVWIGSVAPGAFTLSIVKSGGSPSVPVSTGSISLTNNIAATMVGQFSITAGDSVVVNFATGDSAQVLNWSFLELSQ